MTDNKSAAFRAAMDAVAQMQPAATDMLQYHSGGKALLLLPPQEESIAEEALLPLSATAVKVADADAVRVTGYLGAFQVYHAGKELPPMDIIIDYHTPPLIQRQQPRLRTLPLGYFAAAAHPQQTLDAARQMVGAFSKPRYFSYQPELCAHSASTISGCSRCLTACSTQAITSAGDKISVNPYLCQGCGGCVMTCPSGALRYAYPSAKDMMDTVHAAINAYRRESTHAPTVLFYAADCAAVIHGAKLPPHILPLAVEEAGVAGLEIWFATLAYGAAQVALYADNDSILELANEQLTIARALFEALHLPAAISVLADLSALAAQPPGQPLAEPASFVAGNDKRYMFFMALNHFVKHAAMADEIIPLPAFAPFGDISVDGGRCTLCMACAGACPVSAIHAGSTAPRLTFVEENCVQCGLCAATCPEDAVTLTPRMNTDKNARRQERLLNEDKPVHCLRCQKPFAGERMINTIAEKLKAHWMFQQPQELRRLRLCEECRVIDMFDGSGKQE